MSVRVIDAVFRHSASKGSARLVLLAMADAAHDSGELTAYARSQSHLAAKANVDGSTVARSIRQLVTLGEVEVLTRGDGRASSDYRIHLPGLGDEGGQDATPARAPRPPRGGTSPTQGAQDALPIIPSSPDPTPSVPQPPRDVLVGTGFDRFWSAWPRKVAKGAARKAFNVAMRETGSVEILVAAAEAYRDDPNLPPAQFIPHPATWLRDERYLDGPLPPRGDKPASQGRAIMDDRDAPEGRLEL